MTTQPQPQQHQIADGPETDPSAPRRQDDRAPTWAGPVAGLLAAATAVCVGMLTAAIVDVDSPLNAVGSEFIDHTPKWLKLRAIEWFGSDDKLALRIGMVVTIAGLSLAVGAVARSRRLIGVTAIAAFGMVGAFVAAGRPAAGASAAIPALLGAAVGCWLLWFLIGIVVTNDGAAEVPGVSRAPRGWDRRRFIVASGSAAAVAVVGAGTARALENRRISDLRDAVPRTLPDLPNLPTGTTLAVESAPGKSLPGAAGTATDVARQPPIPPGAQIFAETPFITPNDDFYLIDTALSLPRINLDTWKVDIGGMVSNPFSLSYSDLLARPMVERTITICCVSNEIGGEYIGNATWQGVLLADLLKQAGVDPAAEQIFGTSVDGWTCGFPVEAAFDGRDAMIAIGMNGEPIPLEHGFPARVIVPGLYGYISATKWLQRLDLTTWDQAEGYWIPRGWARDAPIKTQSRIDVPRRGDSVTAGKVVVAGVAWAQHRGIDKVEVRVDQGEWGLATLAVDVSDDTWRQWTFDWDATSGDHQVQVRATDKTGATQTEEVSRPDPDGATGYHTRSFSVS